MNCIGLPTLVATAILGASASVAFAQSAPPTYQADPSVYKVIFEDQNFRVIAATWGPGVHDKAHSHPVASVAYALTDCKLKITETDGSTHEISPKAGSAQSVPITQSHSAENVGPAECRTVFVEVK
jgi:hypothetical protein